MRSDLDDTALVHRVATGDVDAFEVLVRRHSGAAYRTALRIVSDTHEAQDVTQESFVAAWRGIDGFRGEASFGTWVHRIVVRRALNHVTRGRTRQVTDLVADVPDLPPVEPTGDGPWGDAVEAALRALSPLQRTMFVLHHVEGLSYAEIAVATGHSVGAVRSHLFRARKVLASSWGERRPVRPGSSIS